MQLTKADGSAICPADFNLPPGFVGVVILPEQLASRKEIGPCLSCRIGTVYQYSQSVQEDGKDPSIALRNQCDSCSGRTTFDPNGIIQMREDGIMCLNCDNILPLGVTGLCGRC